MAFEKYGFDGPYQDHLLACIIQKPLEFFKYAGILNSAYFTGTHRIAAARALLKYWKEHNRFPTWDVLQQLVYNAIARTADKKEEESILVYVKKLGEMDTQDAPEIAREVVNFAKQRAVWLAFDKGFQYYTEEKTPPEGWVGLFEEAQKVGLDVEDMGYIIGKESDIEQIIKDYKAPSNGVKIGGQWALLDNIWRNGFGAGWLISVLAPSKMFKCLGKGTGILMFDGFSKPVEEIRVGDRIMGDDSTPRKVLTCGRGHGPLFSVNQSRGKDFVCNDAHIMCLRHLDGRIKEMTIKNYTEKAGWFRGQWQGYKAAVNFPAQSVPLEAYFLGLWLGDGTSAKPEICVADKDTQIADYIHGYANKLGMRLTLRNEKGCRLFQLAQSIKRGKSCSVAGCLEPHRVGGFCLRHYNAKYHQEKFKVLPVGQIHWKNTVTDALRSLGVFQNKHIPKVYKINDRATRLSLLAGLIDSDGCSQGGALVFTNVNKRLIDDVCWLARSLGFFAHVTSYMSKIKSIGYTGIAWKVRIIGPLSQIPNLLPRKHKPDSIRHRHQRYKIKSIAIGDGDYYGFTIDGNGRFLLDDFTVTHNTTFCLNIALSMARMGKTVFYYPCEITQIDAAIKALRCLTDLTQDCLIDKEEVFLSQCLREASTMNGELLIKGYPSRSVTISQTIHAHALMMEMQYGMKPDAIFIDFAETVIPNVEKNVSDHRAQAHIYVEARALGFKMRCPVFLPDRCNKETVELSVPNITSFQGAVEKAGHIDVGIGLCADPREQKDHQIRYFIFANRHGETGLHYRGTAHGDTGRMTIDERIEWNPEADSA